MRAYSTLLGTTKKAFFGFRRVFQDCVAHPAVGDRVIAQGQRRLDRGAHGLDIGNINLIEQLDPFENAVELAGQGVDTVGRLSDARQLGDAAHVIRGHRHGRVSGKKQRQ